MLLILPVILNEVFYDAVGADGGYHFVELINRDTLAVSLAGYRLEAGDGAGPDRWHTVWSAAAGDVVAPGARFTIGEGRVEPLPDRVLAFDLENGPDAVRLVAPGGATDVLGYGALTYASYFEGRPAVDVAPGYSLARLPDGVDTDDNAADWAAVSPPTPGAPNHPERDLAIARAMLVAERLEPGDVVTVEATVANRGAFSLVEGEIDARLWAAPLAGAGEAPGPLRGDSLVARVALEDLAAGDSARVRLEFVPPSAGAWRVTAAANTLDDNLPANDRVALIAQVGAGELLVSEALAAPADGPEWVEVVNASAQEVALDGWTLEDATGKRGRVTVGASGAFSVLPESLVVLTADASALRTRYPGLAAHQVATCQPWATLNNDPPGGSPPGTAADRVVLRSPDGRASDALELPAAAADRSRERRSIRRPTRDPANWSDSAVRGGTPGRVNSVAGAPAGPGVALAVAPEHRLHGSAEPLLVTWRTGFERGRVVIAIYDLRGRRVRLLLDEPEAPGTAGAAWDGADDAGRDVPPGLYVVGLEARAPGGAAYARSRAWLSVE